MSTEPPTTPDPTSVSEKVSPGREGAALSRELSDFLIEFSIGVHRFAMYPRDHPSLRPIVQSIVARLADIFADRQHLSIGVAAKQLIIEGVATDTSHPVLSDLAARLHSHQLGALSLQLGVGAAEVSQLLVALAEECERDGVPLGLREGDDFPRWKYARLYKVGYDKLELRDQTGEEYGPIDHSTELWIGLAQAALQSDEPFDEPPEPAVVARSIEGNQRGGAYDQVIVGYMLQIAEELKDAGTKEAAKIRARVSGLMNELDEETLARLVEFGGNPAQRKKFVLDANQGLAVDSVLKVLQAAATSSEQTISTSMTRMLSKMAVHAGRGSAAMKKEADTALRQNVESLMEGWELTDPNPEEYTSVLDAMSKAAPILSAPETEKALTGSQRILQMAVEVDVLGPTVSKALFDLVEEGEIALLLELAERASDMNAVARSIMRHMSHPDRLSKIMENEKVDMAVLQNLVSKIGEPAANPLLNTLTVAESRSVRRRTFDILAKMGDFVGRRVLERVDDDRWYVQRNMLALLQHYPSVLEGFDPGPYLHHEDHRVRQEALPLAVRPGSPHRDLALVSSLSDEHERIVRMGLLALQQSVPDAAVATLVQHVVALKTRSVEIRALGAKALGRSRVALARTTLIEIATAGKTMFGRPRIAPKTLLVLAALRALTEAWQGHPDVEPIFKSARRSKDPEVRSAVEPMESVEGAHV